MYSNHRIKWAISIEKKGLLSDPVITVKARSMEQARQCLSDLLVSSLRGKVSELQLAQIADALAADLELIPAASGQSG